MHNTRVVLSGPRIELAQLTPRDSLAGGANATRRQCAEIGRKRDIRIPRGKGLAAFLRCSAVDETGEGVVNEKVTGKWRSDPHRPRVMRSRSRGRREALTGERAGRVFSRVRQSLRDADAVRGSGRHHRVHRYREVYQSPARSEAPSMYGNISHGNREIPSPPRAAVALGRFGNLRTHAEDERTWEVGQLVQYRRSARTKAGIRGGGHGGKPAGQGEHRTEDASQTPSWNDALSGLERCARSSKEGQAVTVHGATSPCIRSTLESSFYTLKREAAPGVDGVTWTEYEKGLSERLQDLHSRVHRGTYRAQPSKRAYIPKADGRKRPLGIAALEDKIVQHAVVTVLNQIYEEDFLGFSYGFRPGRRQHDALDALWVGI